MTKKIIILFALFLLPIFVSADRGMVIWPENAKIDQSAQNAIVAWNEKEEALILTADTLSVAGGTVLRIIPFPSQPDIKEGDVAIFNKLVDLIGKKPIAEDITDTAGGLNRTTGAESVQIIFQDVIGNHDLTTVKAEKSEDLIAWINKFQSDKNLSTRDISESDLATALANYIRKDIKYFVFDVIDASKNKQTAKPLIYKFASEYLYYPLLISGATDIGNSTAKIDLFLITKKNFSLVSFDYGYFGFTNYKLNNVYINKTELENISSNLSSLFSDYNDQIRVIRLRSENNLKNLKKDLILYSSKFWDTSLFYGNRGEKVKAMQKILINEYDLWAYEVGATGYFGRTTESVLKTFQFRYISDYLTKRNYSTGTGIFGPISRSYLQRISLYQYE